MSCVDFFRVRNFSKFVYRFDPISIMQQASPRCRLRVPTQDRYSRRNAVPVRHLGRAIQAAVASRVKSFRLGNHWRGDWLMISKIYKILCFCFKLIFFAQPHHEQIVLHHFLIYYNINIKWKSPSILLIKFYTVELNTNCILQNYIFLIYLKHYFALICIS